MDTIKLAQSSKVKGQNFNHDINSFKFLATVLTFDFCVLSLKPRRSFTLIELLIVIAIIAILIGVLVPSMSRSLSGNRLASDVEVLRAKIEETRLLAGSTQIDDEIAGNEIAGKDRVGYYGILIPGSDVINNPQTYGSHFYAIVRLSDPFTYFAGNEGYCTGNKALTDAINDNRDSGTCLIEKVKLTKGIEYENYYMYNIQAKLIAFRVPSQQLSEIYCPVPCGETPFVYTLVEPPRFLQRDARNVIVEPHSNIYLQLKYNDKTATVKIEAYTGKLVVVYN